MLLAVLDAIAAGMLFSAKMPKPFRGEAPFLE